MATITGTFNSLIAGTISGSVATPGATGPAGPTGATGATGPAGPGVPSGGLEGQILLKASDTSYDTVWADNTAETLTATVRNETGATLPKGTVVYITGAAGNKALVSKASASSEATSSKTFAILAEDILNNQNGTAVTVGLLKNLDTSALTEGGSLWLSTTAGQWTQTMPTAPNHAVFLGTVTRVHANQGTVEVRIQNGLELQELHNVKITSVSNGQVLKYDSAQSLWVNGTDSSGVAWGGISGTLSSQTDLQSALDLKLPKAGGVITGDIQSNNGSGYRSFDGAYKQTNVSASIIQLLDANVGGTTLSIESSGITFPSGKQTVHYPGTSILSGYATESWVTSQGYLTSSALTPYLTTSAAASTYLTQSNAASTYQTQAGMTNYLSKAGNLSGLSSTSTARTNLGLGTLSTVNDAPADGSQYARKNNAWEVVSGGGGGSTWGSITGTLSSQTDLQSALDAKASLSGAGFTGTVTAPTPTAIANDGEVINRAFSEFNLGLNWADLVSTRVSNITFGISASDPESPVEYDQTVYFDFCCPDGFNNLFSVNSGYPSISFSIYLSGIQQTSWNVTSSTIASTGNSRMLYASFPSGNSYEVYVEISNGGGVIQKSRHKIGSFST